MKQKIITFSSRMEKHKIFETIKNFYQALPLTPFFDSNICLRKKFHSGIIYRYTFSNCKVTLITARLLITEKLFVTFTPENMCISSFTGKYLKNV